MKSIQLHTATRSSILSWSNSWHGVNWAVPILPYLVFLNNVEHKNFCMEDRKKQHVDYHASSWHLTNRSSLLFPKTRRKMVGCTCVMSPVARMIRRWQFLCIKINKSIYNKPPTCHLYLNQPQLQRKWTNENKKPLCCCNFVGMTKDCNWRCPFSCRCFERRNEMRQRS